MPSLLDASLDLINARLGSKCPMMDSICRYAAILTLLGLFLFGHGTAAFAHDSPSKSASVFYPDRLIRQVKVNARHSPWVAKAVRRIVAEVEPWRRMSDDELWSLMFGPTITRSWMVWSNGH